MGIGCGGLGRVSPVRHRAQRGIKKRAKRKVLTLAAENFTPFLEYADKPVEFCKDVLGVELTGIQIAIAEAVRDHPRVSVAACYASGKTFLAACLLLWWLFTRSPALIVTTAPTARQVKELLWSYVRRLHKRARVKLGGRLLTQKLEIDEDQRAFGFTGNSGHAVQGIHEAANVLFVEDEAAGMKPEIVADFEGITTGEGSRHLKIGNPTSDSGPFFDTHMTPEVAKEWKPFNIAAHHVIEGQQGRKVKGLIEQVWVDRIERQYGKDSPFWICKVEGKFLRTAGAKVVPIEWRDLAKFRYHELPRVAGKKILGCDIGRSIDPCVFVELEGRHARVVHQVSKADDLTLVADEIERVAVEVGADVVNIDGTGLGIGVCDIIRRRRNDGISKIPDSVIVNYCVLSESADEKELFHKIIDEVCWAMRRAFSPDNPEAIAINPDDAELCDEVCWRGWGLDDQKFKVWTKKMIRKAHGRSCDFADALMLCFWPSMEWAVL